MMKPSVLDETMNIGWKKFLLSDPDLTEAMAWILENVTEKIIRNFIFAHTKIKAEEVQY